MDSGAQSYYCSFKAIWLDVLLQGCEGVRWVGGCARGVAVLLMGRQTCVCVCVCVCVCHEYILFLFSSTRTGRVPEQTSSPQCHFVVFIVCMRVCVCACVFMCVVVGVCPSMPLFFCCCLACSLQLQAHPVFRGNVSAPGARRASFVTRALPVDCCR